MKEFFNEIESSKIHLNMKVIIWMVLIFIQLSYICSIYSNLYFLRVPAKDQDMKCNRMRSNNGI